MDVREGAHVSWVCRGLYSVPSHIRINCIHFIAAEETQYLPKNTWGGFPMHIRPFITIYTPENIGRLRRCGSRTQKTPP
jgi:hypothetical protein